MLATRAERIRAACAQPGAQRHGRRAQHHLRADLWLAVRARPRQQAALRHAGGSAEFREARLHDAEHPPFRRRDLRAGGRAGAEAPSRHRLQPHQIFRQALHGHRDRAGARRGLREDGAHPVRRCLHRCRQDGHDLDRQLQLADGVGREHAVGAARLCPRQPGGAGDALHHGGRDGAGQHRGRDRAAQRRGAGRHRLWPAGAAGIADGLWQLRHHRLDAIGRADDGHGGARDDDLCLLPAGAALQAAGAHRRHAERIQGRRRAGGL